jgi:fructose-specific phosphotransferase system IIC component
MIVIRPLRASVAATTSSLAAGTAIAHEGAYLLAHSHPHPGLAHVVVGSTVAGALLWALRASRRR